MKDIFKIFIPTLLSNSTFILINLIDGAFVGNLFGLEGQTAVGLVLPILLICSAFIFALTIGGNTYLGHAIGKKAPEESNKIFSHLVIYGTIFISIIVLLLLLLFYPIILQKIDNVGVLKYFQQYLFILLPAYIFLYLAISLGFIQRLKGNSKVLIYQAEIALITDVIFNYLFAVVLNLSMLGIALASALSYIFQFLYIVYSFKKEKTNLKVKFFKFDKKLFSKIVINGLSDGIYDIAASLTQLLNITLLSIFIYEVAPSYVYVLNNILMTQLIIFFSLSDSINPLISVEYGKKNYYNIIKYRNSALKLSFVIGIISYLVINLIKNPLLIMLGVNNINDQTYLLNYSTIYFLVVLVFGLNQTLVAYLTAIGRGKLSLILGIMRNIIMIILVTVVLTYFFQEVGLWSAYFVAELLSFVVIILILRIKNPLKSENVL
ncbi:MAG: MATE family efflux transporter [Mycoplasmatales bacterium]